VTTIPIDNPLAAARRRLDDAVHGLADPVPVWDHGTCRWSDAVYDRLRVALAGGAGNRTGARRTVPCRVDVLTLPVEAEADWLLWRNVDAGVTRMSGREFFCSSAARSVTTGVAYAAISNSGTKGGLP
jgi:hypothetical protein